MSDDLVTRLRARTKLFTASTLRPEISYGPPALQAEAADEIERLRAAADKLAEASRYFEREAERLRSQVRELVEALEEIVYDGTCGFDSTYSRAHAAIKKAKEV